MKINRWLYLLILIPVILFSGFSIWAYTPLGPMPEAIDAMQSNASVQVSDDRWLVFEPTSTTVETGLIIYPGGRVDPRSYSPLAQRLASEGYLVVIVPMPFNLAVFGSGGASNVIEAFPDIENWVIAGHSLGGSMSARYVIQHPQNIQGLILLASYPAASDDLSGSTISSLSIFGTLDGLTSMQDINNSRPILPADTSWVPVEGGNHAQFGWYGDQPGDNAADISREQQQNLILEAMIGFLEQVN